MEITIKLEWVLPVLSALVIAYFLLMAAIEWNQARKLHMEGLAWIEDHRRRLKGDNRYPVGENYFAQAFPECSTKITHRVWVQFVREHQFESDPMDGQWCIAKRL